HVRRPVEHALAGAQLCARRERRLDVRAHRALRLEVAAVALQEGDMSRRHADAARLDELVREAVLAQASDRAGDQRAGLQADVELLTHAYRRSSRATLSSTRRSTSPRSTFVFVIP